MVFQWKTLVSPSSGQILSGNVCGWGNFSSGFIGAPLFQSPCLSHASSVLNMFQKMHLIPCITRGSELSSVFMQFLWRPRPPSLLTPEKEEEILKNLKKYSKKYEIDDAESTLAMSAADMENRRKVQDEWKAWVAEWKRLEDEEKDLRIELRDGEASDEEEECEAEEVEVEEIISIQEEAVSFGFEQLD